MTVYIHSIAMKFVYGLFLGLCCIESVSSQVGTLESTFTLETISAIAIPYQNGMAVPSCEKQNRPTIVLSGLWKKNRFAANHTVTMAKRDSTGYAQLLVESAGRHLPQFDDASWPPKQIPGVENTLNANEKTPEYYQDGVWYRKSFSVHDSLKNKFARLQFYAVNYIADVWLNGVYLGWHEGGFTPFSFDVSSAIRTDTVNVLAVRVDNIPWGTRKDIVPYYECDWFNYTGIIHDVYLEFTDAIATCRADVVTKNINGLVDITVLLENHGNTAGNADISLTVFEAKDDSQSMMLERPVDIAGSVSSVLGVREHSLSLPADSIAVWRTALTVQQPKLWSPKHPNLYVLKVTVSQNGTVKDEFYTQFGIRTVKTDGDKILLNELPVFLHGVARHEDHPVYGRSIPATVIYSDILQAKKVNANYLRTGHYPNHPFTYLAADRLGLIVMEEIPVWWFDESFPWLIQSNVRFIHRQMFREMAFRDRNRASIALWSMSNECMDVAGRRVFYQMIRTDIENNYPDGRLLTQSAAADRPGSFDESQNDCDVAGWTMYFGIFYNPSNLGKYRGTKYFTVDAHDFFPKKPIIATEFGYWSGESMTLFGKQTETFDSTFLAFEPRVPVEKNGSYNPSGFMAGVTWWCLFDWYTHQQMGGFQSMGLIRMNRDVEKPVYGSVKAKYGQYVDRSEYITDVEQTGKSNGVPERVELLQNFPNPFNPVTTITYRIPESGFVTLKVFDALGREIALLINEMKTAGEYSAQFNASGMSTGVYFYQLHIGQSFVTKKLAVVK